MTLQDTIKALPDEDFAQLKAWIVTTETDRRAAQPAVEQARAEDTQKLWDAHPDPEPDPAPETPTEGENEGTTTPGDNVPVTEFKPGEQVKVGDLRLYNGTLYEVLQEHTTALHWAPDTTQSLWKQVTQ